MPLPYSTTPEVPSEKQRFGNEDAEVDQDEGREVHG